MIDLLVFILSTAGLSWIFTKSKIFKPLREKITLRKQIYEITKKSIITELANNKLNLKLYTFLDNILNCHGCFGFWAGLICYLLMLLNLEIILYAFIGSISSLLLIGLFNFLERK